MEMRANPSKITSESKVRDLRSLDTIGESNNWALNYPWVIFGKNTVCLGVLRAGEG